MVHAGLFQTIRGCQWQSSARLIDAYIEEDAAVGGIIIQAILYLITC